MAKHLIEKINNVGESGSPDLTKQISKELGKNAV